MKTFFQDFFALCLTIVLGFETGYFAVLYKNDLPPFDSPKSAITHAIDHHKVTPYAVSQKKEKYLNNLGEQIDDRYSKTLSIR